MKFAKYGKIKSMIWLFNKNLINDYNLIYEWTFAYAAKYGDLNILKWLLGKNFNSDTFFYAAKNGNLDNMKWLLKK
jgi:hypothetical protein